MNLKTEQSVLHISDAACQFDGLPRPWGPGIRDQYIIHYVSKGRGTCCCSGKTHRVHAGQCFYIEPGTLVHYGPDPEDPWSYGWINFSGSLARELLNQTSFGPDNPVVDADPAIAEIFLEAAAGFAQRSPGGQCRSLAALLQILARLLDRYPSGSRKRSPGPSTDAAVEYIRVNYQRHDLSVSSLARALNISTSSLNRDFMQELQISPKEYITKVRIAKAITLLRETEFPIKSIAYSVGYGDQLYFSKVFRSRKGCSPREYREFSRNRDPGSPTPIPGAEPPEPAGSRKGPENP